MKTLKLNKVKIRYVNGQEEIVNLVIPLEDTVRAINPDTAQEVSLELASDSDIEFIQD